MVKTLTKHGNSLALVIEKPVLELLHISQTTLLNIATDGSSLVITPVTPEGHDERLQSALEKVNKKYGNALRNLAK